MEISVPIEKLRERKLFLATPMYGGQCAGMFARSVADLSSLCAQWGVEVRFFFLFNESLITRARNYCCDEFMRSGSTHLMFVDSDIGFNPNDVLAMLAMMDDEGPYDVMTGPYPKKCISWEKIKLAVDKGVADDDPNNLEQFVGDYVFNPKGGVTEIPLDMPAEVLEAGTGFMMIRKSAMERFRDAYPDKSYRPDHIRTAHFDGSREITAYFDCVIEPTTKRYLSEDYAFCQQLSAIGGRVWMCPWMQLQHVGSYVFGGSLAALASIGATPTADASQLKKRK